MTAKKKMSDRDKARKNASQGNFAASAMAMFKETDEEDPGDGDDTMVSGLQFFSKDMHTIKTFSPPCFLTVIDRKSLV